jgi:hypothetical protein
MADKKISQLTAATLPLAGTEVLPIVQGGVTTKVATDDLTVKNFRSNASTGLLQVAGPGAGTTRVMTTPNANFTAARTDAAQTFSGNQTFNNNLFLPSGVAVVGETTAGMYIDVMNGTADAQRVRITTTGTDGLILATRSGGTTPNLIFRIDASEYFRIGNSGNLTATNGNVIIGTAGKGIDFSANTGAAGMTSELLNWYEEGAWTPSVAAGSGSITTVGTVVGNYTRIGRLVTLFASVTITNNGTGSGSIRISGIPFPVSANIPEYVGVGSNGSTAKTINAILNGSQIYVFYYDGAYPVASGQTLSISLTYQV